MWIQKLRGRMESITVTIRTWMQDAMKSVSVGIVYDLFTLGPTFIRAIAVKLPSPTLPEDIEMPVDIGRSK